MAGQRQRPATVSVAASNRRIISATTVAAVTLIVVGTFFGLVGLVAIVEGRMLVIEGNRVYQFDGTAWGWMQLILGVVVLLSGSVGWRARRHVSRSADAP